MKGFQKCITFAFLFSVVLMFSGVAQAQPVWCPTGETWTTCCKTECGSTATAGGGHCVFSQACGSVGEDIAYCFLRGKTCSVLTHGCCLGGSPVKPTANSIDVPGVSKKPSTSTCLDRADKPENELQTHI